LSLDTCRRLYDNAVAEGQKDVYFGKPNPSQEQCDSVDLDICPDLILAFIAAASAAAFIALYIAITTNANGRRKKKRSAAKPGHAFTFMEKAGDMIAIGMSSQGELVTEEMSTNPIFSNSVKFNQIHN
jgi:hypothetical protein